VAGSEAEIVAKMLAAARAAMSRAYAPYSNFPVGAALLGANGRIYAGCNVENAAFPQGCCAETSAISAMIADGEREILAALVLGEGTDLIAPCGGCRQRLNEFAKPETPVHLCGTGGVERSITLGELLPFAFGPQNLGGSRS
jgi:cytidine deaminase